jgi:hypothetical protein
VTIDNTYISDEEEILQTRRLSPSEKERLLDILRKRHRLPICLFTIMSIAMIPSAIGAIIEIIAQVIKSPYSQNGFGIISIIGPTLGVLVFPILILWFLIRMIKALKKSESQVQNDDVVCIERECVGMGTVSEWELWEGNYRSWYRKHTWPCVYVKIYEYTVKTRVSRYVAGYCDLGTKLVICSFDDFRTAWHLEVLLKE